ncbi:recombinase XerD [Cellulomonas taurus]|uniref:recombinase XerD n=1 Tax=Cellulomonas taurus TaxID=2729175 RepID=UPI00197D25F9|nr:recombinase XerD [Cellulomonas taurus]
MTDPLAGLRPRNTTRGRPRVIGSRLCARCGRKAPKTRATWPEGRICAVCFYEATHCHGICAGCGAERLTPGLREDGARLCGPCAGIATDFTCAGCGNEAEVNRARLCARCLLRGELDHLIVRNAADPDAMTRLVDILCAAGRPESIRTWKRSTKVQDLLTALSSGAVPLTHEGLDAYRPGLHVNHLRALLEHNGLLPDREPYLAHFELWIAAKLAPLPTSIARPVEQFATWHHLRRIRGMTVTDRTLRGPVHHSKQEITETIKFLTWLERTHGRTVAQCRQGDIDAYLQPGPTTRYFIRTFFVFARAHRLCGALTVPHRVARVRPALTQEQRVAWIGEMLAGTSESLPYRTAGVLLLLLAQPLVKVVALRVDAVHDKPDGMTLRLGEPATPLPEPFAGLLRAHLLTRPNQATGNANSPWLFPSTRAGRHLHANTAMMRLRNLGINLQGARNRALDGLVTEAPPPVVADALGYSHVIAFQHQEAAGGTWARYTGLARARPSAPPSR